MLAAARRLDQRPPTWMVACARRLFAIRQRRELYAQLALAAEAGMREAEAVTFIWRVRTRDGRDSRLHPFSVFCRDAAFALNQEGRSLPEVALRWSSGIERPLLVAAVTRGGSAETYRELASYLQSAVMLRRAIASVLANALLVVLVACGTGAFLAYYFFPAIENFVDGRRLPGSAKYLFLTAIAFRSYWPVLALGAIALATSLTLALPRLTGTVRDSLDRVEPFRTYRMFTAGIFLAGTAILLRAGVSERKALALQRHHATPYLAERIRRLERIDAVFGQRLNWLQGLWPDHRVKIEALFAASASDPTGEYGRIGAGLVQRTLEHCRRLAHASSWIASFLLVAAILWILVATNDFSDHVRGDWQ